MLITELPPPSNLNKSKAQTQTQNTAAWKRVLAIASASAAMLGIVIIFILNFFTGCVITPIGEGIDYTNATIGFSSDTSKVNVFYYLGSVYTDIRNALTSVSANISGAYKNSFFAFGIFGTILSSCSLIAVTALTIVCAVKYVKLILGRPTKNFGTWALVTYFVYVACCAMFLNLNAYSYSFYNGTEQTTISASIGLNGACVAGIAVGAVMFAVYYVSQLVINAKTTFSRENLPKLICTGISIILLIVVMVLASGAAIGYEMTKTTATITTVTADGVETTTTKSLSDITNIMSNFLTLVINGNFDSKATAVTSKINGLFAESIMAQIFSFALLGVCAVALACTLAELIGEDHRLLNAILLGSALAAAVAYSIFAVLSITTFTGILENLEVFKETETAVSESVTTKITYAFTSSISKVIAVDVILLLAFVSYIILSVIKWINKQNALSMEQQTYQPVDAENINAAEINDTETNYAEAAPVEDAQGGAV